MRATIASATPKLQVRFPELTYVTPNVSEALLTMDATDWSLERKRKAAEAAQAILRIPVRMYFPDKSMVYIPDGARGRTVYFPSPDIFAKATGKPHTSRQGQALVDAMGITVADLKKHPMELAELRIWDDMKLGIQLGFEDVSARENIADTAIGKGPWLVTEVIFWNVPTTEQPYAGAKPFGIQFDMTRQEIRERVAARLIFEDTAADVWDLGDLELAVNYVESTQAIRCISYSLPQKRH